MNLEEQRAHYAAVRARLTRQPIKPTAPTVSLPPVPVFLSDEERRRSLLVGAPLSSRLKEQIAPILMEHNISWKSLWAPVRRAEYHHPRRLVWRALSDAGMSLLQCGQVTGRDHTTVLHGLRRLDGKIPKRSARRAREDARELRGCRDDRAADQVDFDARAQVECVV